MFRRNSKFYSLILIATDTFFLISAFTASYIIRVWYDSRPLVNDVYGMDYLQASLFIIPFWLLIFGALGLYQPTVYNRRLLEWSKIAIGSFIGVLFVIGWQYISGVEILPARLVIVYILLGSIALIIAEREILRFVRAWMYRYGKGVRRVLLVGSSEATADIAYNLSNTSISGYQIVAIAGPKSALPKNGGSFKHYNSVESAIKDLRINRITTIIQTDLYDSTERNQSILSAAQSNHIEYSFIPGEAGFYSGKNTVDIFLGYPIMAVHQTPLIGWGAILKRLFDLVFVLLLSPIWIPIFITLAILQKIFNRGPIFFINTRLGQYGKIIKIYKFRSMIPKYCGQDAIKIFKQMGRDDLAEEMAKTRKVKNDPRITKFGKLLRITSLDEVAQIINVLKGEMSLVGPRPILPDEKVFYKNRGSLLFSVKPGLTGLWQVSGRNDMPFEQRVELELFYAQNWTFWLDMKILLKTIMVVIKRNGAR